MIGETGIYELNLEGIGTITSIRFENFSDKASQNLDSYYNPKDNIEADGNRADRLLIDIIYEGVWEWVSTEVYIIKPLMLSQKF